MCGKFTQMASWRDVHAFSQPIVLKPAGDRIETATPMRFARVMRLNAHGDREMIPMRWGFSRGPDTHPGRPGHMHARAETVDRLPTFREAFARQRGLLFVHTFNEGEELPNGRTKQWVITPKDGEPVAIAVICETRRQGDTAIRTFVQVTTPANRLIAPLTDRMPAILPREAWPAWLGETSATLSEIKALLTPFEENGAWTLAPQARPAPASPTDSQPDLFS